MKLFFGTQNQGKLRELRRQVTGLAVEVVSPADLDRPLPDVPEDGATFEANAEHKAREYAQLTGLLALADDSGLCVDALGGAPGVHSARWSELTPGPAPASPVCELAHAGVGPRRALLDGAGASPPETQRAAAELGPDAARGARPMRPAQRPSTLARMAPSGPASASTAR